MTAVLQAMPLAVVMVAGPQIITAIFLAVSRDWFKNSVAYLLGVALATVLGTSLMWMVASFANDTAAQGKASRPYLTLAIIALLAFLAVRVFLGRHQSEPPKWMSSLVNATPRRAFVLGFLLFFLMPTDVVAMAAVAGFLADNGRPLADAWGFFVATLFLASLPLMLDLMLGKRAATALPRVRTWITANAWIISEAVLLVFLYANVKRLFGE